MAAPKRTRITRGPVVFAIDHPSVTADTTIKIAKVPTGQGKLRIREIQYVNATGLAVDAANFFKIQLKAGSTLIGEWSTETGQDGALVANTFVALPLEAGANVVDAGAVLDLVLDETGTQTLPAGRLVVHGEFL